MSNSIDQVMNELRNFPTEVVSDTMRALGVADGWLTGLKKQTIKSDKSVVGRVMTLQNASNRYEHAHYPNFFEVIRQRKDATIILITGGTSNDMLMGDNMALAAKLAGFDAVIADGYVRDVEGFPENEFHVWSKGVEGYHGDGSLVAYDVPIMFCNIWINPGDIVMADQSGALVFPISYATDILDHARIFTKLEKEQKEIIQRQGSIKELNNIFHRKSKLDEKY